MKDYSISYLDIHHAQRKLYSALTERNWPVVTALTDDIIVAAREIRAYSMDQMNHDTGSQGQKAST